MKETSTVSVHQCSLKLYLLISYTINFQLKFNTEKAEH